MLSKCANPLCSNTFRYLHQGRLYVINSVSRRDGRKRFSRCISESQTPEYAWLCTVCCSCMTIAIDEENGTIVLRMGETLKCQELCLGKL